MTKLITFLSAITLAIPASANTYQVVNPNEPMVVVPGLERLGPSRISTVQHCQQLEGTNDWRELITDSDFERMHICLQEHT